MNLTKDQILAAPDLPTIAVEVPEWGGSVNLKAFDVATAMAFHKARETSHDVEIFALLVAFSAVDERGNPLFTPDEARALVKKSPAILSRLGKAVLKLNGMTPDDQEEAVKNS